MKQHQSGGLFLLVFLTWFLAVQLKAQGWGTNFMTSAGGPFESAGNYMTGLHPFSNDNTMFVVNNPDGHANYYLGHVIPTGQAGYMTNPSFSGENDAWHHFSTDLLALSKDSMLVLEHKMPYNGGLREIYLTLYYYNDMAQASSRYKLTWHQKVFSHPTLDVYAHRVIETSSGEFVVLGGIQTAPTELTFNPLLVKTDAGGNPLWQVTLASTTHAAPIAVQEAADGGFYVVKAVSTNTTPQTGETWLVKLSASGVLEWEKKVGGAGSEAPGALLQSADGSLLIAGNRLDAPGVFFLKLDPLGNQLWWQDYPMPQAQSIQISRVLEQPDGTLAIVGSIDNDIVIQKTGADGTPIWEKKFGTPGRVARAADASVTHDGGYVVGGSIKTSGGLVLAYIFKTDLNGIIKPGLITGNVLQDFNLDCAQNTGDIPMENWVVTAFKDSTRILYGTTDAFGNYRIESDSGRYTLHLTLPSPYWAACNNDVTTFVGYLDSVQVHFLAKPLASCPYMTVDHSYSRVRPCTQTTFQVRYCNLGTITAQSAYVQIKIDSLFTFLTGSILPSANVDNMLTFPLGDVAPLECRQFNFTAEVACNLDTGLVACSQAHIFPDSLCFPGGPNWSGAFIAVAGKCLGDSIQFTLKNIGTGPSQTLEYIVIEDAVLLRQGNFQLAPDQEMILTQPTNGSTFHLLAQQEPGVPGNDQPTVGVEACVGNGSQVPVSTGFFNQFSQNDAAPFLSDFCLPVVNSYDPNDKQAFPTGFGEAHNIFAHTELEYQIRFQNTGTDTAFRVVLLDTLSAYLDPASIRPGASSHPYRFSVEDNGVLRFTFQPIHLPQAAVNEAASQGFVSFRIRQKAGNRVGTKFQNRAGIYFDFNKPVITNAVAHTIHQPLIRVTSFVAQPKAPAIRILAYPNPFVDQIRFEIIQESAVEAQLEVYNLAGQCLNRQKFSGNTLLLARDGLPSGLYCFVIRGEKGELLGAGKMVVE